MVADEAGNQNSEVQYPDDNKCQELFKKYCLPEKIQEHSKQVTKVADFIANKFNENGHYVDEELVHSAAMLHDIAKPVDFTDYSNFSEKCSNLWKDLKKRFEHDRHPEAAYFLLKDKYPEVAKVIRKHAYKAVISDDPDMRPLTREEKIVTYADKRVAHKDIVNLKERFEEGHKRWRNEPHYDPDLAQEVDNKYFELEKELFSKIDINPEDITKQV